MATTLILVRHGQTEHNQAGMTAGWTDSALAESGREQAWLVATHIAATYRLDALYASPLQRALDTARAIGQATGLAPVPDPDLREQNFGDVEGLTVEEAQQRYPEISARARVVDDLSFSWPNGERRSDFYGRVLRAMARIAANHPEQTVGIVTHGGVIGAYVADVQEGKAYLWRNYLVDNCSVTIVTVEHTGRRAVRLYNDTSFMPAQPVDPLTASLREVDRATKR